MASLVYVYGGEGVERCVSVRLRSWVWSEAAEGADVEVEFGSRLASPGGCVEGCEVKVWGSLLLSYRTWWLRVGETRSL